MKSSKKLFIYIFSLIIIGCSNNKYYKVKKGDTLYSIAVKNKISVTELMDLNNIYTSKINPGDKMLIQKDANKSKKNPKFHVVKSGETLYRLSVWYDISVSSLKKYNNLNDNNICVGQKIYLYPKIITKEPIAPKNKISSPVLKAFRWPIKNKIITSPFGIRIHPVTGKNINHDGVDIKANINTPVYAPYSGVITYAGWMRGYGKVIVIDHGKGYSTKYAHLNSWLVKKGKKISKGQIIGKTGNTGLSTGPHLHYEILINNKPVDPTITM
jgi:murein DD-endopeptidase MepM/ murein hydrolase activator NlpD